MSRRNLNAVSTIAAVVFAVTGALSCVTMVRSLWQQVGAGNSLTQGRLVYELLGDVGYFVYLAGLTTFLATFALRSRLGSRVLESAALFALVGVLVNFVLGGFGWGMDLLTRFSVLEALRYAFFMFEAVALTLFFRAFGRRLRQFDVPLKGAAFLALTSTGLVFVAYAYAIIAEGHRVAGQLQMTWLRAVTEFFLLSLIPALLRNVVLTLFFWMFWRSIGARGAR